MLDVVASRVNGVVKAKDCRVVWTEGTLYIARSETDIVALTCEEPVKRGGYYRVNLGESTLTWTPPGCGSCRRRVQASPLGRMTVEEIIAAVSVDA